MIKLSGFFRSTKAKKIVPGWLVDTEINESRYVIPAGWTVMPFDSIGIPLVAIFETENEDNGCRVLIHDVQFVLDLIFKAQKASEE